MMLTREETVSQATNGCFCLHHTNLILKISSLCWWQRNTACYVSKLFKVEWIKIRRLIICPVVSYGCEIWSPTFREERSLKVYFVLWPTNAQLYHKLSHPYMSQHCRVILKSLYSMPCQVTRVFQMQLLLIEFVIKMFHVGFLWNILIINRITNSCIWNTCITW
jgi:hypothetical protein